MVIIGPVQKTIVRVVCKTLGCAAHAKCKPLHGSPRGCLVTRQVYLVEDLIIAVANKEKVIAGYTCTKNCI